MVAPIDERHPEAPSGYPTPFHQSLICASTANPRPTTSGSFGLLCKMLVATPSIGIHPPEGMFNLGLPLSTLTAGNITGYEDRLNLNSETYYYSIVTTDGFDEFDSVQTIEVTPTQSIRVSEAISRDLIGAEDANPGDRVTLSFHPFGRLPRQRYACPAYGGRPSILIHRSCRAADLCTHWHHLWRFRGYFGGRFDQVLMRFADFVVALRFCCS